MSGRIRAARIPLGRLLTSLATGGVRLSLLCRNGLPEGARFDKVGCTRLPIVVDFLCPLASIREGGNDTECLRVDLWRDVLIRSRPD